MNEDRAKWTDSDYLGGNSTDLGDGLIIEDEEGKSN